MKRLEKLYKPPCDLTMYDNEEYENNPLLKFRLKDVHDRRHFELLKRRAAKVKMRLCRQPIDDLSPIRPREEKYYIDNIKRHVREIPVPKMLRKTEFKIKSYCPPRLKQMYPDLVNKYMAEVHENYDKLMKVFSMKKILKNPEFDDEDPKDFQFEKPDMRFKNQGRTSRYSVYLANRRRLKTNLILIKPYISCVLQISELNFPEIITDFADFNGDPKENSKKLNEDLGINIKDVMTKIKRSLDMNSMSVKGKWHFKIYAILKKNFRKRVITAAQWPRVAKCCEGLMNRQLNVLKIRNLNYLTEVLLMPRKIPHLLIRLECSANALDINPSFKSIFESYVDIATDIRNIGDNLEPLEYVDPYFSRDKKDNLRVELSDIYFNEYCDRMRHCLVVTYTPVMRLLQEYKEKYFILYGIEALNDLHDFLSEPRTFDEYFEKIELYFKFVNMLRSEPERHFFDVAILNTGPAMITLRELTKSHIDRVTQNIIIEHMKEEQEICRIFEEIKEIALKIPRSTEELLAGADFMIHIKTEKIPEMRERIVTCVRIGIEIVSLMEMSKEHMDLTIETISWLTKIYDVMDQNATLHEQYKFIFEEHLQDVVKKLNEDLADIIPKMSVIDDMSDESKLSDYYIHLQNFMDQLKTLDDYVVWINKEEKLFKIPLTKYPNLETLTDYVYPFATLMK